MKYFQQRHTNVTPQINKQKHSQTYTEIEKDYRHRHSN